jgi:predicted dehydrogenase
MAHSFNRRNFIRTSSLAGAGIMLAGLDSFATYSGRPGDKVIIGLMGTNSRGMSLAKSFSKLPNVEVGFICDPDETVLNKTIAEMEKLTGKKPQGFKDVRKMLQQKDLDAMAIAAPDHWHAPAAIMGLQAGKHVYVEKPCSHNPNEGELLVAAQKKYNKQVQMGNQRRSYGNVIDMINKLHTGAIGRVYFARGWYTNSRKSIGKGKIIAPPANLDFDLWQGPAPRRSYQDNLVHYNWHWFWHWGTGEALNNGTHMIDLMRWGLQVDYPTRVSSAGGRFHFQDDWETPDTQIISYNFANNTAFTWEGRSCNGFDSEGSGTGVTFFGDNGTIMYKGGNSYMQYDYAGKLVSEVKDDTKGDPTNKVSPFEALDGAHLHNFCEAIRGKGKLNSPIVEGHKSTLLPQLGNIAQRVGRVLNCDSKNGHILNDSEAMKLWKRSYEKGWEVVV